MTTAAEESKWEELKRGARHVPDCLATVIALSLLPLTFSRLGAPFPLLRPEYCCLRLLAICMTSSSFPPSCFAFTVFAGSAGVTASSIPNLGGTWSLFLILICYGLHFDAVALMNLEFFVNCRPDHLLCITQMKKSIRYNVRYFSGRLSNHSTNNREPR